MVLSRRFTRIIMTIFALTFTSGIIYAQQIFTEQDAINTAAESEEFKDGLANTPGWTAAAYDTGNRFGIWRVQFWNASGDELGWADVSPARGKVYSWEAYFGATDAQVQMAQDPVRDFLTTHPTVLELVEDPTQHELYIEYDSYNRWWGAYMDMGLDSLYLVVRFGQGSPDVFEDPQLVRLYFSNVMSYAEWQEATRAQAVATGFQQPEIAAVLADVESWTTRAERSDDGDGVWTVYFMDGETVLAWVKVDMSTQTVVEFSIEG